VPQIPHIFDIGSAHDLFKLAEQHFMAYRDKPVKTTGDVILIVMIVNHLREWIAPKFEPTRQLPNGKLKWPTADTPEKRFSQKIYQNADFAVVRQLCNGTKHSKVMPSTKSHPLELVGSSPDVKVVITGGVASGHLVDGRPFEDVIGPLMSEYRSWFGV
jgi:hypothetical protein